MMWIPIKTFFARNDSTIKQKREEPLCHFRCHSSFFAYSRSRTRETCTMWAHKCGPSTTIRYLNEAMWCMSIDVRLLRVTMVFVTNVWRCFVIGSELFRKFVRSFSDYLCWQFINEFQFGSVCLSFIVFTCDYRSWSSVEIVNEKNQRNKHKISSW